MPPRRAQDQPLPRERRETTVLKPERVSEIKPISPVETRHRLDEEQEKTEQRFVRVGEQWRKEAVPENLLRYVDENLVEEDDAEVDPNMEARMAEVAIEQGRKDKLAARKAELQQRMAQELEISKYVRSFTDQVNRVQAQIAELQRATDAAAARQQRAQSGVMHRLFKNNQARVDQLVQEQSTNTARLKELEAQRDLIKNEMQPYKDALEQTIMARTQAQQEVQLLQELLNQEEETPISERITPVPEAKYASRESEQRRLVGLSFKLDQVNAEQDQVEAEIERLEATTVDAKTQRQTPTPELTQRMVDLRTSIEQKQNRREKFTKGLERLQALKKEAGAGFKGLFNGRRVAEYEEQIQDQKAEIARLDQAIVADQVFLNASSQELERTSGPWTADRHRVDEVLAAAYARKDELAAERVRLEKELNT